MKRKLLDKKLRRMAQRARKTRVQSLNRAIHRDILGVSPLRAAYPFVEISMDYNTFMHKALLDDLEHVISNAFGVLMG